MKIIYFAPVEWNSIKQRPQHISQRLAQQHDFYYVHPLGLRNIKFSDFGRIIKRVRSIFTTHKDEQKIHILNPLFIPIASNRFIDKINTWLLQRQFKKLVDTKTVIWIVTPNNIMLPLLSKLKFKALIYEMLDDYSKIHVVRQKEINNIEKQLINKADLVITTASALQDKVKYINLEKKSLLVSNGVDYKFFTGTKFKKPAILQNMRKIIGYIGAIDKWMDLEVVDFIAKNRPDIDFVFIGPVRVKQIPKRVNLHFLGAKEYQVLPHYLYYFDVCLIPFQPGEFTNTINPVKLYEYFALGKSVVTFDMQELRIFKELLYIAENKQDFLLKLDLALNEKKDFKAKRQAVAKVNDWSHKVETIEKALLQLMDK